MDIKVIELQEHDSISNSLTEQEITSLHFQPKKDWARPEDVWAFGLDQSYYLSYYIGLDWLDREQGIAIRSTPKINNLDFQTMFKTCLDSPIAGPELGSAYAVKASSSFIPSDDDSFDFTPLLMHHFLTLLEKLVKRPLKKGYITRQENLKAKVKGKILVGDQIRMNMVGLKPDRIACSFQEFSTDCPENRLLHSSYRIATDYLYSLELRQDSRSWRLFQYTQIGQYFQNIGLIKEPRQLYAIRSNPLYRDYGEALRLAFLIYRINGYRDTHRISGKTMIPPYIIDMSKLFELYVYHCLSEIAKRDIRYQVRGYYEAVDFVDPGECLIIDTKYKPKYGEKYGEQDDIRQIAGYARDRKIREKAGAIDEKIELDCLLIYPKKDGWSPGYNAKNGNWSYKDNWKNIEQFSGFYKMGICLPVLQ